MRSADQHAELRRTDAERGAALVTALIILALLAAISVSVLAVVSSEANIAGSDLQRTQTFYAAAAGIEKMTSDFSELFQRTLHPTAQDLNQIASSPPSELISEGFSFQQQLARDDDTLQKMRQSQGITDNSFPRVQIPNGAFAGLYATVEPYKLVTTATMVRTGVQVRLEREMNNYLIPLFQFGMFSDGDLELHPGPPFYFNGRVHANGNIYLTGDVTFLSKVTTANEIVRDVLRNGNLFQNSGNVRWQIGSYTVQLTMGSVINGPNLPGAQPGGRGYFPDSPNGTPNTSWETVSVAPADGSANKLGGQLLTRTTGAAPLYLPLQLGNNPTREIIKRRLPTDDDILSQSRYHTKAVVRILIDDENSDTTGDAAAIPPGKGVKLSSFDPIPLDGGRALARVNDDGTYNSTDLAKCVQQGASGKCADTVRGVKGSSVPPNGPSGNKTTIPPGAGLSGRILIEIVKPDGTTLDVTREILSLGMTEGEPNGIVYLQRPLWAAFIQGSRDRDGRRVSLVDLLSRTRWAADGELKPNGSVDIPTTLVGLTAVLDSNYGYLKTSSTLSDGNPANLDDDDPTDPNVSNSSKPPIRLDSPCQGANSPCWNTIVPIQVYNVREGWLNTGFNKYTVYERGVTSVVEINMRNLARWLDGVYDTNLLRGTNAVSTNVNDTDGYVIYVSDRRGDKVRTEILPSGATLTMTNGIADNEDIYGPNNALDPGEDVIDAGFDASGQPKKGTLQKDTSELPDPTGPGVNTWSVASNADLLTRFTRARTVEGYGFSVRFFRRAVRLFNGEDLVVTGSPGKLSSTKGISVASENLVYVWGNYNTIGINCQPANGATLNDPTQPCYYGGDQVPASIVCDAIFPLSKTWFDASSALFPEGGSKRPADANLPSVADSTSVRAGIIAGNNLSALAGQPDAGNGNESRLCGGMHNFPRFLEDWSNVRWNFVGSLIPLYRSTQALAPYRADSTIYSAPIRNWAFDTTFNDPNRLPPGTPSFQFIQPTGFRQVISG
ncbi:hypothetical protein [Pyrinomonas methylaliphatogenes]|uniref:Type 4 fimbrial biogenesis protein PilX N-terminal domain-containing protein n=1 Tax=Pyrinomonas methylaliphatogenes TaxID=454194 RepID=A0A0B6X0Y3_9BACT|nr:hypothetical protein [Pyrinomonas methylaliphatogenes]CDM66214.1 hypothetical protein PYK22_02228 [Pyrinomonas methylaliphatogenes]